MKKTLKITALFLLTVMIIVSAVSCSAKMMNSGAAAEDRYYDSSFNGSYKSDYEYSSDSVLGGASPEKPAPDEYGSVTDSSDSQKIIKTGSITIESKEFDTAVEDIKQILSGKGGYIASSDITGSSVYADKTARRASFTLAVPADKFEAFLDEVSGKFNVLYKNTNSQDITDTYYDTKSRLNSLITQEERLLSMLETADKLDYMLQLESRLSEVRYEIEKYNSMLQRYDKQVAYSSVSLVLREVVEYTKIVEEPKTFGERLTSALKGSWNNFLDGGEDFLVWLIYALPGLIIFLLIILVIVLIISGAVKKSKRKRSERLASQNRYMPDLPNIDDLDSEK